MKKSEKMKKLEQAMRKLNDTRPSKPNPIFQSVVHSEDVDEMSKEALIAVISTKQYWFSFCDDYGSICWRDTETTEQTNKRYEKEVAEMTRWEDAVARTIKLIDEERIAMKNAKKILDARYSDPEYIDYLRMQTKMKERGLV